MRLYGKKWYQKNRKRVQLQHKEYYLRNKESLQQYHKKWYQKNKEELLRNSKNCYQKNKEKVQQRHRLYNQAHKRRLLKYKGFWQKYKRRVNPRYRLDENMGTAISTSLKSKKAGRPWETLAGYTLEDLIKHLEKQFDDKMNWSNYGGYWVVDHITPKSLFSYIFPNNLEFKQCWALENLQPLEKIKNIKKKNNRLI